MPQHTKGSEPRDLRARRHEAGRGRHRRTLGRGGRPADLDRLDADRSYQVPTYLFRTRRWDSKMDLPSSVVELPQRQHPSPAVTRRDADCLADRARMRAPNWVVRPPYDDRAG